MDFSKKIIETQKNYFLEFEDTKNNLLKNLENYFSNNKNQNDIENKKLLIDKLIINNDLMFKLRNELEELNYSIISQKFNITNEDKEFLHEYNERKEYEKDIKDFISKKYIQENLL